MKKFTAISIIVFFYAGVSFSDDIKPLPRGIGNIKLGMSLLEVRDGLPLTKWPVGEGGYYYEGNWIGNSTYKVKLTIRSIYLEFARNTLVYLLIDYGNNDNPINVIKNAIYAYGEPEISHRITKELGLDITEYTWRDNDIKYTLDVTLGVNIYGKKYVQFIESIKFKNYESRK